MVGDLADAYLAVTCAARQSVTALPVFDKWPRRSDTVGKQSSGRSHCSLSAGASGSSRITTRLLSE